MRKVVLITILLLCSLGTLIAQSVINASGEYTYIAPSNVSIEEAKQIALERARLQCLADCFGTIVNQAHTTMMRAVDGESEVSHFLLGESEVKGEWLGDLKQPVYKITYDEVTGSNIVHVKVFGKVREIRKPKIDVSVQILCNGITPRHERERFYEGDQLFLSFTSPVAGYLCVYLVDEDANAFCLLPYSSSSQGVHSVAANKKHVFFSNEQSDGNELVDEYAMSCIHDGEMNMFYIVYSPNTFSKAIDQLSSSLQQLKLKQLQDWLLDIQSKDADLQVIRKTIIINKLRQ
ncbi:MAG: DUF4384 domain-containing protein [Prevotella sp.]|nr:DUF4384 domain-containing protein [Prevotella sp.]MBP3574785.1 DUF4384 domain-containing protein [Prevotella sp.]